MAICAVGCFVSGGQDRLQAAYKVATASSRFDWGAVTDYLERIGLVPLTLRFGWLADHLGGEIPASERERMLPLSGTEARFTVHYTPKHGSWLNQAEIEIGMLSRQCLGTRRIPELKTLEKEVRAWNRDANSRRTQIKWKLDRKQARRKFGYKKKMSNGQSTTR